MYKQWSWGNFINVVQNEGTLNGFDFSILDLIAKSFEVPVIVNGGINSYEEIRKFLTIDKVDAVGIGAFLYIMVRTKQY